MKAEEQKKNTTMKPEIMQTATTDKSREQIKAEREAKKAVKQAAKTKSKEKSGENTVPATTKPESTPKIEPKASKPVEKEVPKTAETPATQSSEEKSREQIKAEREAKKLAKQAAKSKGKGEVPTPANVSSQVEKLAESVSAMALTETEGDKKKATLSKAERRAIQEAQRAAKAAKAAPKAPSKSTAEKEKAPKQSNKSVVPREKSASPAKSEEKKSAKDCKIKLFSHLEYTKGTELVPINGNLHPSIIQLGEQYSKRTIVGSNARYFAFLNAIVKVSFLVWCVYINMTILTCFTLADDPSVESS